MSIIPIQKGDTCPICLEKFQVNQRLAYHDVKHPFHFDCIKDWAWNNKDCPVCRREIKQDQLFTPIEKAQKAILVKAQQIATFLVQASREERQPTALEFILDNSM